MKYGMPTLVECKGIGECIDVAERLGLDFIEINMSFPQYQPSELDYRALLQITSEKGISFTIHADEQLGVVTGKLREQDRRGHVTDALAGKHADEQGVLFKQSREDHSHALDARHIARKDKEKHEGQKERIIHLCKRRAVCKEQNGGNDDESDPIGNAAEYDRDRENEKREIKHGARGGKLYFLSLKLKRIRLDEDHTAERNQRDRDNKGRRHYRHKLARGDIELGVEIEVLRISKGREHSAEICRDVLHYKGKRHIFLLARRGKHEISERQKGEQRHIVGDQHRADKGYVNESQHAHTRVLEEAHDLLGKHIEKSDVLERANDGQRAEQTAQRFQIKIFRISRVGRYHDRCDRGRQNGDAQDGVLTNEASGGTQQLAYRYEMRARAMSRFHKRLSFLRPCRTRCYLDAHET